MRASNNNLLITYKPIQFFPKETNSQARDMYVKDCVAKVYKALNELYNEEV